MEEKQLNEALERLLMNEATIKETLRNIHLEIIEILSYIDGTKKEIKKILGVDNE